MIWSVAGARAAKELEIKYYVLQPCHIFQWRRSFVVVIHRLAQYVGNKLVHRSEFGGFCGGSPWIGLSSFQLDRLERVHANDVPNNHIREFLTSDINAHYQQQ
jgi:hypothetical protein